MLQQKRYTLVLMAILLSVLMISSCKTSGQHNSIKEGFVKIFDGKTLSGWKGDSSYWRVENGNLVGEITPEKLLKTNSFIIWQGGTPGDFELTLEFRITKNGNSGINYRSVAVQDVPNAVKGYQADIDGENRYTGQNYEERGRTTLAYRGEVVTINSPANSATAFADHIKNNAWTERIVTASLGSADSLKATIKAEDWNTCHLIAKGNRLQHFINDILTSEVIDNDKLNGKAMGLLGVQVHVGPPMKVEYRNIMLKQLK